MKPKEQYLEQYILSRFIFVILALSTVMIIFVTYFSNQMIRRDAIGDLRHSSIQDGRYIFLKDNHVVIDDNFVFQDDDIVKVILDADGKVLAGKYSDADLSNVPISEITRFHTIKCSSGNYFIFDRKIELTKPRHQVTDSPRHVFVRTIINAIDVDSKNKTLKYISYASIIALVLVSLCFIYIMSRQIVKPLGLFCEMAETVGQKGDLSTRIEYDGNFYEIRTMAEANNRMMDRIEEMYESQKQFTSDVAHELRTPIAITLGECQYISRYLKMDAEIKDSFEVINRQTVRMKNIITQLLQLSRLDQHRQKIQFEYVDMQELVESACEIEEMKIGEKKDVTIIQNLCSAEAWIDVGLMLCVVQNLIDNAVKYSKDHSEVRVSLTKAPQADGNYVVLSVDDDGCGMTPEQQQHILDRFYRANTSRNEEGFGLGLSIVDKIIQIHHARLEITSTPEKGSTFQVWIPEKQQ